MKDSIKIYSSPTCPMCTAIKSVFTRKGIEFEVCEDVEEMRTLGISSLPHVKIGDRLLTGQEAIEWVHTRNK